MAQVDYDKKSLHLYFTDNCSTDDTVEVLQFYKKQYKGVFGAFEIACSQVNEGFGKASNHSARMGKSEYVFFYNTDTEIHPNAFSEMEKAILKADDKVAAFEMRQFPYEHPKYYDPVTLKTDWASGAAVIVKRSIFELTGGFDESIFMYCEDVDFSWRIRAAGYDIQYVPTAITQHYTADDITEMKTSQIAGQLSGERVLRLKFGTKQQVKNWKEYRELFERFMQKDPKSRELAAKLLERVKKNEAQYRRFYHRFIQKGTFVPNFEPGYTFHRAGVTYVNELPQTKPQITVVIRTYKRPNVLRLTLQSLLNQTYKNFKVIVVEDGEQPTAGEVVSSFENDLDIRYLPLNKSLGRCEAGNVGLSHVDTQYACFLDDDDYYFADFMEVNAKLIEKNPDCGMFCSGSVEAKTRKKNADGSEFVFEQKRNLSAKHLQRASFYADNPVPIQAVVFDIELFRKWGGFDPALDAFEDWDLWIRYATHCSIAWVDKSLSIFKVPAEKKEIDQRNRAMERYRVAMYEKMAQYSCSFTAQEIRRLFYRPEDEVESGEKDFEQLCVSAQEIQKSTIWRVTKPLRVMFNGLSNAVGKLSHASDALKTVFGPLPAKGMFEDYAQVQRFVTKTERSLCWRMLRKLKMIQ